MRVDQGLPDQARVPSGSRGGGLAGAGLGCLADGGCLRCGCAMDRAGRDALRPARAKFLADGADATVWHGRALLRVLPGFCGMALGGVRAYRRASRSEGGADMLAVSSTALIVYGWSRRLTTGWWAFTAAAMTVALPALAYSGLMMTESVFLLTMTVALSLLARALSDPSPKPLVAAGALALPVAVRLQGLGLLPQPLWRRY